MEHYHKNWPRFRRERLEYDGYRCQTCNLGTDSPFVKQLEVHHKTYERWGHEDVKNDLITLCSDCHKAITDVIRRRRYLGGNRGHHLTYIEPVDPNGGLPNGMAKKEIQIDWHNGDVDAQRPISFSRKQMVSFAEGDFWQEEQNGRGS